MSANAQETVPQKIGETHVYATKFTVTSVQGRAYEGQVIVEDRHRHQSYQWKAFYLGEGHWKISGQGAFRGENKSRADAETYPFTMDPFFNRELKLFISDQLNRGKENVSAPRPAPRPNLPVQSISLVPTAATSAMGSKLPKSCRIDGDGKIWVKIDRIRPFSGQPRKYFDPAAQQSLIESISEDTLLTPPSVKLLNNDPLHDFELIDGQRRWFAAKAAHLDEINVVIGKPKDEVEQHMHSLVQNHNRDYHTAVDLSNALQYQIDHGMTVTQLCRRLGKKPTWVRLYLALQKLHPDLRALLDPPTPKKERLRKPIAKMLSRAPQEEQIRVYSLIKDEIPKMQEFNARQLLDQYIEKQRSDDPSRHIKNFLCFCARLKADTVRRSNLSDEDLKYLTQYKRHKIAEVLEILADAQKVLATLAKVVACANQSGEDGLIKRSGTLTVDGSTVPSKVFSVATVPDEQEVRP